MDANPAPKVAGLESLSGKVNYFRGNDPEQWRTGIPTYARVKYEKVYPGIDLVYYGNQRQLQYDFVVAPGADPKAIRLAFQGAEKLEVDNQGELVLQTPGGKVRFNRPFIYQEVDGVRQEIAGGYMLQEQQVGFWVSKYDTTKPLIIDPILIYSTFLGGGFNENRTKIALDTDGNAYVTGMTLSNNFPSTINAAQPTRSGFNDAFIAKLSADAYVIGTTNSTNFPTIFPLQDFCALRFDGFCQDAFVTKLSAEGSALLFSTYFGGSELDTGNGIAVDTTNRIYITGRTGSPDFPTSNPLQPAIAGGNDAYVAKIDCVSDFSDQVNVVRSGFRKNRATGRYLQQVTISNPANPSIPDEASIEGPISLVLDNLSTNAALFNKTGSTTCAELLGSSFINVEISGDNLLSPGENATVILEFTNPTNESITYDTRVLAGPGDR